MIEGIFVGPAKAVEKTVPHRIDLSRKGTSVVSKSSVFLSAELLIRIYRKKEIPSKTFDLSS